MRALFDTYCRNCPINPHPRHLNEPRIFIEKLGSESVPVRSGVLPKLRVRTMVLRVMRVTVFLAALLVAWSVAGPVGVDQAQAGHPRTAPDLFYNYYVPSGPCGGAPAQLYLSPRPTPPLVGHTYITYQPLMPHEFLYRHTRSYYRQNQNRKWTRTMVIWY